MKENYCIDKSRLGKNNIDTEPPCSVYILT